MELNDRMKDALRAIYPHDGVVAVSDLEDVYTSTINALADRDLVATIEGDNGLKVEFTPLGRTIALKLAGEDPSGGESSVKLREVVETVSWIFDTLRYFDREDPAIPHVYSRGSCPLWVIVGENCGGKSFFRRLVTLKLREVLDEVMHLSMQARVGDTFQPGIFRSMLYGNEAHDATSANSSRLVTGAINNASNREHDVAIFWDEPDIGMSAGTAAGVGDHLANWVVELPEHVRAVFLVSHSDHLLRRLVPVDPNFICLGDVLCDSLEEWIDRPVEPVSPEKVTERGKRRFDRIQAILDGE